MILMLIIAKSCRHRYRPGGLSLDRFSVSCAEKSLLKGLEELLANCFHCMNGKLSHSQAFVVFL